MSCDVFKSHLYKNIFYSCNILSSASIFLLWSRVQFCTTAHLNTSFWPPPKLWDVGSSIWFNFMQKNSVLLWKFWVSQRHLHSGPSWWFVQQPYFCLLFNPWLFILLVVLHVKPLSPGAWTFWIIFGSWNNAIYLLSRIVVLQNLH